MSKYSKVIIVNPYYGPTIREALDRLSNGGYIIVESGIYTIDDEDNRLMIPSNTTLIGKGNVVINVKGNVRAICNKSSEDGNERITISGFKIVVCKEATPYNNHLVFFQNIKNSLIKNLTITMEQDFLSQGIISGNAAILLYSAGEEKYCSDNTISQCHIDYYGKIYNTNYNFGNGIVLSTYETNISKCKNNLLKNNRVLGCATNCYLINSSNNTITDNIFSMSQGGIQGHDGILLWKSCNNILSNNICNNNAEHGIYSSGCKHCTIQNNILHANAASGIQLRFANPNVSDEYNTISGNVCILNGYTAPMGGNGIHLLAYAEHNTIAGNVCVNNHNNGIRLQKEDAFPNNPAINNVVDGNTCLLHSGSPGTDKPIAVDDPRNIVAFNKTGTLPA